MAEGEQQVSAVGFATARMSWTVLRRQLGAVIPAQWPNCFAVLDTYFKQADTSAELVAALSDAQAILRSHPETVTAADRQATLDRIADALVKARAV